MCLNFCYLDILWRMELHRSSRKIIIPEDFSSFLDEKAIGHGDDLICSALDNLSDLRLAYMDDIKREVDCVLSFMLQKVRSVCFSICDRVIIGIYPTFLMPERDRG